MAILVEEDKPPVNWVGILTAIIIVVVLFAGGYYVFFKKPQVLENIAVPPELQANQPLVGITFDPSPLIEKLNKFFRQYAQDIIMPAVGRENPFRPF
ncbi:MAG: hypothetical protein QMD65_03210 [Patescibacteria group bacterium]|nr:hypothetical protein [Patescibacteria group bacterium]